MSERDLSGVGELQALLGQGAEFDGKLVFSGRIRIEGRFSGEIRSDDVLILGPSAEVRASVHVGTLIVRGGTLWGPVHATRLVEVYAPGKIHGDVAAPQFFLDKGAYFDGQCTMVKENSSVEAAPEIEDEQVAT